MLNAIINAIAFLPFLIAAVTVLSFGSTCFEVMSFILPSATYRNIKTLLVQLVDPKAF